jgi:hypothetical protein
LQIKESFFTKDEPEHFLFGIRVGSQKNKVFQPLIAGWLPLQLEA